jgi:hypothetical protein
MLSTFTLWKDYVMIGTKLIKGIFPLAAIVSLTACVTPPVADGRFYLDGRPIKIEELRRRDVYASLTEDWAKFDKYVKDEPQMSAKIPINRHLQLTPPFPTNWPPQHLRSVTYYAYAQYSEFRIHGPMLSRSAPWAKVVLNEGARENKVMLASTLGSGAHGESSVPISQELADRKMRIIKDGEAHLSNFVSWKAIPQDEVEVKAIREYYCQWRLTDRTADLIQDNHRPFFQWLSCPPRTLVPVLQ